MSERERRPDHTRELPKQDTITTPPPVEAFFDPDARANMWPADIRDNPEFTRQIEIRKTLVDALRTIIPTLPTPDTALHEALQTGIVTREQVDTLYQSFVTMLEDEAYDRSVLYFPFELLPDVNDTDEAAQNFRHAYMDAWDRMLAVHDVRANFVDGDVIEVHLRDGDVPRTVKAMHLAPKLVEAGMITVSDIVHIYTETADPLLRETILETLPVLRDMQLLTDADTRMLRDTRDAAVFETLEALDMSPPGERPKRFREFTPDSLSKHIQRRFTDIETRTYDESVTKKRAEWLEEVAKEEVMELLSTAAARHIRDGDDVTTFLADGTESATKQVIIEGIRKAVLESNDATLYQQYQTPLEHLWHADEQVHEALRRLYFHIHSRRIISDTDMDRLGIMIPHIEGPFTNNMQEMQQELRDLTAITERIAQDPVLRDVVYPSMVVFGSRLKGYGTSESDIDVAVFMKPGTDRAGIDDIRARLDEVISHEHIHGPAFEFWLQESPDGITIDNTDGEHPRIGEDTWTHVLMGGIWTGDKDTVQRLQQSILPSFLKKSEAVSHGLPFREACLQELERDTLQYRLLHKGYDRYRARVGGIDSPRKETIDGDSMFWDSGYRQAAIQLYAERVFLPVVE